MLPAVSSQARCHFNGHNLTMELGTAEYSGHEIFTVKSCTLESGFVYGLVGPNGVGKSSFSRLVTSKTLPGFPQGLSCCYVDPHCGTRDDGSNLKPSEFLQRGVESRCEQLREQQEELEEKLADDSLDGQLLEGFAMRLGALCEQEDDLLSSSQTEIASILDDLGFRSAGLLDTAVKDLSSGWRYKCELANALFSHADLLVLDEPSFLDRASMNWLVERTRTIAKGGAIVVLITHKERLLESLADRILFISAGKELETANCGWEAFKLARNNAAEHTRDTIANSETKHGTISKSLTKVQRRMAQNEKSREVAVRKGADRRFIKGKSKEAQQHADKTLASRKKHLGKEVERLQELKKSTLVHEVCPIPLTGSEWAESRQMVTVQDATFGYRPDDDPVLQDVSLAVYGKDRIALTGPNGEGKSTLIKLLLGEVTAQQGTVQRASGLRVAYFPQDALQRLVDTHGAESPLEVLQQRCNLQDVPGRVHLGHFGLKGNLAIRPIHSLSAGQRTRLHLALEFLPGVTPSLLILDEVENLDHDTTEALLSSMASFNGAVLCVSHDEEHLAHFCPRQSWSLSKGRVTVETTDNL